MKRITIKNLTIAPVFILSLLLLPLMSTAQSNKAGSDGGNSQGANSNSSSNKSQNAGQSGGNQGGSSAGITGGSMAIESTIFAYRSLTADADGMVQVILPKVKDQIVIIATSADFTNLVQWRIVMAQGNLLHERAQAAIGSLTSIQIPTEFAPVPKNVPKLGAGPFIASPTDVQTLIQTLASMFAVNESLSVSSGALTSTPLTNLLAARLRSKGSAVYVPAAYTPNLLQRSDIDDTFIGKKLNQLEGDRRGAVEDSQKYLQALEDAKTILSAKADSPYATPAIKSAAANFIDFHSNEINAKVAALVSIVAAIDNFEATLFTGQASVASNPTSGAKQKKATSVQDMPLAGPAQQPVKPLTDSTPSADTTDSQSPAAASSAGAPGNTFQQILLADLLAHQIWNGIDPPDPTTLAKSHILTIQTLESGGGQLTKSNLFTGSKIYFSGGAVATFALYGVNGVLECGGYAYAYGGYVRDKEFVKTLSAKAAPIGAVESDCQP